MESIFARTGLREAKSPNLVISQPVREIGLGIFLMLSMQVLIRSRKFVKENLLTGNVVGYLIKVHLFISFSKSAINPILYLPHILFSFTAPKSF